MPTPPASSISLSLAQPATVAMAAAPHVRIIVLRDGSEIAIMTRLSKQARKQVSGRLIPLHARRFLSVR
jgi:hypothetical protein